jgi:hypothetical protein
MWHLGSPRVWIAVAGLLAASFGALLAATTPAAAAGDIPGVPITSSPVQGHLGGTNGALEVYSIPARFWDRLSLSLTGDPTLFGAPAGPAAISVYGTDAVSVSSSAPLTGATGLSFPITLTYLHLPSSGTYYIAVSTGQPDAAGDYSLAWTVKSPVMIYAPRHSTITAGRAAKIGGLVKLAGDSTPVTGHEVALVRLRRDGSRLRVQTRTTDERGLYEFVIRPRRSGYYRVLSTGTPTLIRTWSSPRLQITVRP